MHATRRAALWAAAVVATVDVLMLRRAWASWGERSALWAGVFALAVGAALCLVPWLRALAAADTSPDGEPPTVWRRVARAGAAIVAGAPLGIALSKTHVAQTRLGALAPALVSVGLIAALLLLPSVTRRRVGGWPAGRAAAAIAGAVALWLDATLPRRLYPSARVTLVAVGFIALACALGAAEDRRPIRWRQLAATLLAGTLLLLAGRALVDVSANSRFVATAQAPAAALVLDAVTMVEPFATRPLARTITAATGTARANGGTGSITSASSASGLAGALKESRIATNGKTDITATNGVAASGLATSGLANGIATTGLANETTANGIGNDTAANSITSGTTANGIAANGIATNGVTTNGTSASGASANDVTTNGLTSGASANGVTNGTPATGAGTNGVTANGTSATGVGAGGPLVSARAGGGISAIGGTSSANAPVAPALAAWTPSTAPLGDAHVVIVTVDALRADRLRPDRMPQLAAAAAHSLAFSHAYAAAPSTAASITALLTAHHPSHLDARPPTLAELARARGWLTAAFYPAGLFFDGGGPLQPYANDRFGFEWADTRTLPAEALTDAVLARVQRLVADGEPRSLLWVHYFDPHEPYEPHGLPTDAPPVARYDAEVAAVDAALARLINGLTILARPTLLVITGDHGEEFGEHGGAYHGSSVYDEQLRVPLVVTVLGRSLLPTTTIALPVSLVDVAPTITELAGLPSTAGDGHPLPPLDPSPREVVAAVQTRRMLLRAPWKLIHDLRRDVDELYDLEADPREQRNVFDLHTDVGGELRAALAQWLNQSPPSLLATRLSDTTQPPAARAQAARELGEREAFAAAAALQAALADRDPAVHAEAALALGQLSDARARAALHALVDDDAYGDRAAIMLGRLRDLAAAPRLAAICRRPFAEGDAAAAALQREAAHYLGFVGGAGDVAALWSVATDPRVRGAAYVAIGRIAGRIGDRRAAGDLLDRFAVEDRPDARADLAWALGLAGDARAVDALAAAAAAEPPLARASEALVRLGSVGTTTWAPNTLRPPAHARPSARPVLQASRAPEPPLPATPPASTVGGVDLVCRRSRVPAVDAALDQWLGASSCTLETPAASLRAVAPAGADVILVRARALGDAAKLTIVVDGVPLPPLMLGPRYQETRMVKPISSMVKPIRIELRREGSAIELDHVLLLRDVTPARL